MPQTVLHHATRKPIPPPPVQARQIRLMPARNEKRENFRRLAAARTERVLEEVRKLTNLSSPNYEFEDAEVAKVFDAIEEAVKEARGRFKRNLNKRKKFSL